MYIKVYRCTYISAPHCLLNISHACFLCTWLLYYIKFNISFRFVSFFSLRWDLYLKQKFLSSKKKHFSYIPYVFFRFGKEFGNFIQIFFLLPWSLFDCHQYRVSFTQSRELSVEPPVVRPTSLTAIPSIQVEKGYTFVVHFYLNLDLSYP